MSFKVGDVVKMKKGTQVYRDYGHLYDTQKCVVSYHRVYRNTLVVYRQSANYMPASAKYFELIYPAIKRTLVKGTLP